MQLNRGRWVLSSVRYWSLMMESVRRKDFLWLLMNDVHTLRHFVRDFFRYIQSEFDGSRAPSDLAKQTVDSMYLKPEVMADLSNLIDGNYDLDFNRTKSPDKPVWRAGGETKMILLCIYLTFLTEFRKELQEYMKYGNVDPNDPSVLQRPPPGRTASVDMLSRWLNTTLRPNFSLFQMNVMKPREFATNTMAEYVATCGVMLPKKMHGWLPIAQREDMPQEGLPESYQVRNHSHQELVQKTFGILCTNPNGSDTPSVLEWCPYTRRPPPNAHEQEQERQRQRQKKRMNSEGERYSNPKFEEERKELRHYAEQIGTAEEKNSWDARDTLESYMEREEDIRNSQHGTMRGLISVEKLRKSLGTPPDYETDVIMQ